MPVDQLSTESQAVLMKRLQVELGSKVRALREEKGYSQEVFASIADLDRTYIADIEGGKRNVSLEVIWKLAKAFGISVSNLLEGVDHYEP